MKFLIHILFLLIVSTVNATDITPIRNVNVFEDSVIVTYEFNGYNILQDNLFKDSKFIEIPGFGINEEKGKPATLGRWDSFVIPTGKCASVSVVDYEFCDTSFCLSPARQPILENDTIGHTSETVLPISTYSNFYPSEIITLGETQEYRGKTIQKIGVYPIQYNHSNRILRVYSKIKYCINFHSSSENESNVRDSGKTKIEISINDYALNSTTINGNNNDTTLNLCDIQESSKEDNRSYLIVSVPNYENSVKKFAEWKKTLGFNVHVSLDESWTKERVKDTIKSLYNETGNLYHILIVGNIEDVPSYDESYRDYNYTTDLYYGCMGDSDDYIPDIYRGRIVVRNNEEAANIFNKIIAYEKMPTIDSTFYKTGIHCAYFQDDNIDGYEDCRFTLTSEEILNYMQQYVGKKITRIYSAKEDVFPTYWNNSEFSFGEEIPSYLKKDYFAWDGDSTDIIENINNGCFYVLLRSHGNRLQWDAPCFRRNNISSLTNKELYPVIFSLCCSTGQYKYKIPYFAESFLKKESGGCVGIFAATEKSLSGYNDLLTSYMFDAIWPDSILRVKMPMASDDRPFTANPIYELGQIMDISMNYLDEVKLSNNNKFHTRAVFHYFGDPSMMIRTETPKKFTPTIKRENGIIKVCSNVENTRISFYTPSTNKVDSYIGDFIEYATTSDSVVVSLSKHNYIPLIANCNRNLFVQNETIKGTRYYAGENVFIGRNVTSLKDEGDVVIENSNITINGKNVILNSGVLINKSEVMINITP